MNLEDATKKFLADESTGAIILGTQATGARRVHPNPRCSKVAWAQKNDRQVKEVKITEDLLVWWGICLECIRRMPDIVDGDTA